MRRFSFIKQISPFPNMIRQKQKPPLPHGSKGGILTSRS